MTTPSIRGTYMILNINDIQVLTSGTECQLIVIPPKNRWYNGRDTFKAMDMFHILIINRF